VAIPLPNGPRRPLRRGRGSAWEDGKRSRRPTPAWFPPSAALSHGRVGRVQPEMLQQGGKDGPLRLGQIGERGLLFHARGAYRLAFLDAFFRQPLTHRPLPCLRPHGGRIVAGKCEERRRKLQERRQVCRGAKQYIPVLRRWRRGTLMGAHSPILQCLGLAKPPLDQGANTLPRI
jgi:hypothetical protein